MKRIHLTKEVPEGGELLPVQMFGPIREYQRATEETVHQVCAPVLRLEAPAPLAPGILDLGQTVSGIEEFGYPKKLDPPTKAVDQVCAPVLLLEAPALLAPGGAAVLERVSAIERFGHPAKRTETQ